MFIFAEFILVAVSLLFFSGKLVFAFPPLQPKHIRDPRSLTRCSDLFDGSSLLL